MPEPALAKQPVASVAATADDGKPRDGNRQQKPAAEAPELPAEPPEIAKERQPNAPSLASGLSLFSKLGVVPLRLELFDPSAGTLAKGCCTVAE